MKNTPLHSAEHTKIAIFLLLLSIFVILIVGIIPLIFISFGILMTKSNEDFSYIETAAKFCKIYSITALLIFSIFVFVSAIKEKNSEIIILVIFAGFLVFACIFLIDYLFLDPLKRHSEWV